MLGPREEQQSIHPSSCCIVAPRKRGAAPLFLCQENLYDHFPSRSPTMFDFIIIFLVRLFLLVHWHFINSSPGDADHPVSQQQRAVHLLSRAVSVQGQIRQYILIPVLSPLHHIVSSHSPPVWALLLASEFYWERNYRKIDGPEKQTRNPSTRDIEICGESQDLLGEEKLISNRLPN